MTGKSLSVLLLLLSSLLAGCSMPDLQDDRPYFLYEGADGSRLEVTFVGHHARLDPWARTQDVLVMQYAYHAAEGQGTYFFEDLIDPATGLLVAQTTSCGSFAYAEGDAPCGRSSFIGSAYGAPALFGMGPTWAGVEDSYRGGTDGAGGTGGASGTVYRVPGGWTPASLSVRADGDCRVVRVDGFGALRTLPWVPLGQEWVDCGDGMPRSFTTSHNPYLAPRAAGEHVVYDLVEARGVVPPPGGDPVQPPTRTGGSLSAPYYVAGLDSGTVFSLAEAHEAARNLSEAYRDLFLEPDAVLLEFEHRNQSRAGLPADLGDTVVHVAAVRAVGGGRMVEVEMERRQSNVAGVDQDPSYSVVVERTTDAPVVATVEPDQVGFQEGLDQVRAFHDVSVALGWVRLGHRFPASGGVQWLATAPQAWRTTGYDLSWFFYDPAGDKAAFIPFHAAVDGVTGAVESVDVPHGHPSVAGIPPSAP